MTTEITAEMVKELRHRTGIGIGKCKQALCEAGGDIEKAIENLRKSGMASAAKKAGRETHEGIVAAAESDERIALVEINAETDFVVANQAFQAFAMDMANEVIQTMPASLDDFLKQKFSKDSSLTIDETRANIVQSLGENIQLSRLVFFNKEPNSSFGLYSHMRGQIVVLVEIDGSSDETGLARDIAMHIAAASPEYISSDEIPEETKSAEREIARAQIKNKPENIIDKIIEGKLRAFYDQTCLLQQKFVKDPDLSIAQLVKKQAKETGKPLVVKRFIRWQVGV